MAKRKRSKGKRRGGKRKSKKGHGAPKHSAAIEAGLGISAYRFVTDKSQTGVNLIDVMKAKNTLSTKLSEVARVGGANAVSWDNDKWVLYGMGLHWAKNKPIAKIILKPVDQLVKMLAGKRYGL